ncbi:MAG: hypothetical protein LUE12_07300 [Ruminococcus sp.]|nr:hypothetical protein [Ruminococcus sp.]
MISSDVSLLFPTEQAKKYAKERKKAFENFPTDYFVNLGAENAARLISPMNIGLVTSLMRAFTDDTETLNYRLDCLEDFINIPQLSDELRGLISELLGKNTDVVSSDDYVNSFMQIKLHMDNLDELVSCINKINEFCKKTSHAIKSEAMKKLFSFFEELPQSGQISEITENLSQLRKAFSKTIRSVKVGINFDSNMLPDSAGIIEIGYDKIYPKGNILEKLVFKTYEGSEQFSEEEHFNSATRHTPEDIDTALFRELSKYTRQFAQKISQTLMSYRSDMFTDLDELENELDYYASAARFVKNVRARGMKMCRPKFTKKNKNSIKLKGVYDLSFYRELVSDNPYSALDKKIVTNDICFDESSGFYIVTGANNGGKTTFAKAVGLACLLAQTGLYVPCEAAEISPVDYIFTHFPREEESGINSSRFTVEIKELKRICDNMTDKSLVILNESLQSTTPAECLEIAKIHLEILAAAGVKGLFVTHLTGLYDEISKINAKCYRTKLSSIVSTVDSESGERLYKMLNGKPPKVSMAYDIYNKFGAKLSDVAKGDG